MSEQEPDSTSEQAAEALCREYARTRDSALRDQLVEQHLHLVNTVARRFAPSGEASEDLVQEGCLGLINAVELFDPARGVKFTTYATHLIVGQIQHYLRDRGKLIRQPAWVQELGAKIARASESLSQELQRDPSEAEIAARLELSESVVREIMQARERTKVASLDAPSETESEPGVALIDSERLKPTSVSLQLPVEDRLLIQEAMKRLKELERNVVQYFFYMELNQTEIARKLGISVNYASYLLRGALGKLRNIVQAEMQAEAVPAAPRVVAAPPPPRPVVASEAGEVPGVLAAPLFYQRLRQEVARAERYPQNFALVLVESDPSSRLARSERVGRAVAAMLRKAIRGVDLVGKLSSSAFALLLPQTGRETRVLAERIRAQIERTPFQVEGEPRPLRITVSLGYAIYPTDGKAEPELMEAAHLALAQAKAAGGNQIAKAGPSAPSLRLVSVA